MMNRFLIFFGAALDAYWLNSRCIRLYRLDAIKRTKIKVNLMENVKLKWLKTGSMSKRKDKLEKQNHKELVP